MRMWAFMLGGLIVWAIHFFGVYGLASLGDVVASADAKAWRVAIAGFSLICVVAALGLFGFAARRLKVATPETRFGLEIAAGGALLGALSVVWQAAPAWIGH